MTPKEQIREALTLAVTRNGWCPVCGLDPRDGHLDDCELDDALALLDTLTVLDPEQTGGARPASVEGTIPLREKFLG